MSFARIDYEKILQLPDVQEYLTRRGEGLCVGGCGVKVPLTKDSNWVWAMRDTLVHGRISRNPEARFIRSDGHWFENKRVTWCGYQSQAMQGFLTPDSPTYAPEMVEVHDFLKEHPVVLRSGLWQFE